MRSASAFLSAACLAGFVSLFATNACEPNQGPGERCDTDQDCQSGLTCSQRVCCQPGASCVTSTVTDSGGDTTSEASVDTNPVPDTNVTDAIGKTCAHTTDCPSGLSCLPGGQCGLQCVGDRDCNPGEHCDCATFSCQSGTSGGAPNCTADAATSDTAVTDSGAIDSGATDTASDDTLDAAETD